ncbi:unnamed protein product [Calicophoron daubneyi]|uniref:Uncharacterized protein n=1 Tax=Calicophoron daubneyi TaxID=300641 RepID=A0AAV2TIX1_CALDB
MLDTLEILFLVGVGGIYVIYATARLCEFLYKTRHKCNINAANERLYVGCQPKSLSVIFVAIATYQLLGPGMYNQKLEDGCFEATKSIISRTLAFGVCVVYWNFLARIGMKTESEYLQKRYGSRFAAYIQVLNRIFGLYHLWKSHIIMWDYHGLFIVRTFIPFFYFMICFGTVSATGGMSVVLVGCPLLWLFSISGLLILFRKTIPYMFRSSPMRSPLDTCYASYSPTELFHSICELLTVQPIYVLYRAAGTRKRANIAMGIALLLFVVDTALYMGVTDGIQQYSKMHNIKLHQVIHHMYGTKLSRSGIFYSTQTPQKMVYISFEHFILLLGTHVTYIIAIFIQHTQSICMDFYLYGLPVWIRRGLILDGRDHHMIFSCLHLVIACLLALLLTRSLPARTSEAILSAPTIEGSLITPVAVLFLLSPLVGDVWSVPAVMTIVLSILLSAVVSHQNPQMLWDTCITAWYEITSFLFTLTCCILFSAFFRSKDYCSPELFFRVYFRIRISEMGSYPISILDKSVLLATMPVRLTDPRRQVVAVPH